MKKQPLQFKIYDSCELYEIIFFVLKGVSVFIVL